MNCGEVNPLLSQENSMPPVLLQLTAFPAWPTGLSYRAARPSKPIKREHWACQYNSGLAYNMAKHLNITVRRSHLSKYWEIPGVASHSHLSLIQGQQTP